MMSSHSAGLTGNLNETSAFQQFSTLAPPACQHAQAGAFACQHFSISANSSLDAVMSVEPDRRR